MVVNIANESEQNVSRVRQYKTLTFMLYMPLQAMRSLTRGSMRSLIRSVFMLLLANISTAYATTPNATTPNVTTPNVTTPNVTTPNVTTPDVATPDVAMENETWVVLGDSISAGYGIPDGEGWVTLLQGRLDASGHTIQLVNESISGDTTAGGLARLPEILGRLEPNVVIIELGGNDGLRGLSTKAMEDNLSKMIALSLSKDIQVLLLGMKTPPNYGRKYGELFESVFDSVSKQHKVRLLPFLLEGVGGFKEHMQDDRIHPNRGAQKMLLDNVWTFLEPEFLNKDI